MYLLTRNEANPNKSLVFKNKNKFIHVDFIVTKSKIYTVICKSRDGINMSFPVLEEPTVDTLPSLPENLEKAIQTVTNHFESNGFVLADTLL